MNTATLIAKLAAIPTPFITEDLRALQAAIDLIRACHERGFIDDSGKVREVIRSVTEKSTEPMVSYFPTADEVNLKEGETLIHLAAAEAARGEGGA